MPSKGVKPTTKTATLTPATRKAKKSAAPVWYFPVPSRRITQTFTGTHHAVDIGVPVGTPLYAPRAGTIEKVSFDAGGYGEHIVLDTIDGLRIYLGHLSEVNVKPGQEVAPGQQIGKTGNTGRSTGPHLHYEIRQGTGSGRVDPLKLLYGQPAASSARISTPTAESVTRSNLLIKPKLSYQSAPTIRTIAGNPTASNIQTAAVQPTKTISPASQKIQPYTAEKPGIGDYIKSGISSVAGGTVGTSKEVKAAAAGASTSIFSGLFDKINWGNVIAAIVGIALISIGVFGLITSETIKQAAAPLVDSIKTAAGGE